MKLLLTNPVVQRAHDGVEPLKKKIGSECCAQLIILFVKSMQTFNCYLSIEMTMRMNENR
jgi:hypothetical protein